MGMSNLDIVRAIQDGTAGGEIRTGKAFYAADFTLREAPSLPYGGTFRGAAGLEDFIDRHEATWAERSFEVLKYVEVGDQVICLVELTARSRRTGKAITMQVTEWWTLRDGQVIDIHEFYFDTAAVAAMA